MTAQERQDSMPPGTVVMVSTWTKLKSKDLDHTKPIVGTLLYWKSDNEAVVLLPDGYILSALNVFPAEEQKVIYDIQ